MFANLTGWHFLIILVIILLLFGAPKLPGLARSLGQSAKIFKAEIKTDDKVDGANASTDPIDDAVNKSTAANTTGPTTTGVDTSNTKQ